MDDRQERKGALNSLSFHMSKILDLCKNNADMLEALEELEIISEEEMEDANDREDYGTVLEKLRSKIDKDPNFIVEFCRRLQSLDDDELAGLGKNILDMYSSALLSEPSASTAVTETNTQCDTTSASNYICKSKIEAQLKKLKSQISTLQGIDSESEEVMASKLTMTQTAMMNFIKGCLDMGCDAHMINVVLENLHTKDTDVVIDGDLYRWCITELRREDAIRNPGSISELEGHTDYEVSDRESPCSIEQLSAQTINFEKEVLQNSLLACHLLDCRQSDGENLAYPHSLWEVNLSGFLHLDAHRNQSSPCKDDFLESFSTSSLEEVANTDCKTGSTIKERNQMATQSGAVHRYLIAKGRSMPNGHVVYYMAFGSHQSLREWGEYHSSFQDGLKKQQEQLPMQFILEKLWEGASVVLTGFSFGGILAHLCATHLWSLSQEICSELLEKNLLCITFGQPVISLSTDTIADKSRFHAVYITDDIMPRMMRYLDPVYTKLANKDLLDRFRSEINPHEIFQNDLSTSVMKQLITLQESNEKKHTNMQRVVHHIERNICRKIDKKLDGHPAKEKVFQHLTRRKHKSSDGPKSALDAMQDLRDILRCLKRQKLEVIPSYVTSVKVVTQGPGLAKCGEGDFEFPTHEEIQEDMFCQHNTEEYLRVLTSHHVRQSPVKFEGADVLNCSDFTRPLVKRLEIHHFSHHKTAALSLDGDNLCFTFKFVLNLHKSEKHYEIAVSQKDSVSSRAIKLNEVQVSVPKDFVNSSGSDVSGDYQEAEETANVSLYTHFGEFSFEHVEVKHKKFYISCRKQQVASLSVAEVIELSFLGALLERHPQNQRSNRYKEIQKFFERIVEIIPVESAYSCIASMNTDRNARNLCQILNDANIRPELSLTFFINAALGIARLRGEAIQLDDATTLEDLFHVFVVTAKKRAKPLLWFRHSSSQSLNEARYLKWFGPDISSNCQNDDMIKYLQKIVDDAIGSSVGTIPAISGENIKKIFEATEPKCAQNSVGRVPAISGKSVKESLEAVEPKGAQKSSVKLLPKVKSPKSLLRDGHNQLLRLQNDARTKLKNHGSSVQRDTSSTKAHNAVLLDFINELRSEELHMCIQIIVAFMEEQVRIPISDFSLSVSYWQLLKLGLGIFRRRMSKDVVAQYISVSKHIRNIADDTGQTVAPCETKNVANSKYAGKLQFLLSASLHQNEPLIVDEKFQIYSLESHLYRRFAQSEHQKVDESTELKTIENNWNSIFKDVGLAKVVSSHRCLIARWLKFSLLIHKLRHELSCHTTVGVVGLVNSGKSTLVKELFKIEAVETGTREEKRTTVPFIYSIPGVENFDVVDFPGVDDQDDSISDLVNLLRTLSQLVVFVVNYRNAHTQAAVEWYKRLGQYAIPHLVCLTHGDRLYAECIEEEQTEHDLTYTKKTIKKQVEIIREKIIAKASDSPLRCLELFSLKVDKDSPLKSQEGQQNIHDAGIKGVRDVGQWIVRSVEEHLKQDADSLKNYLKCT